MNKCAPHVPQAIESLEGRVLLSQVYDLDLTGAAAKGGKPGGGSPPKVGPAIQLDLVAVHELGHSLGLEHTTDKNSIMYAYYNDGYDINYFLSGQDSAVATLRQLYSDASVAANATPWKNSLDPHPNDSVVEVTYSFTPDGARMDKGANTLFATFDALYGSTSAWQGIFSSALDAWASVSDGNLDFTLVSDNGAAFNTGGLSQGDSRFGDIRIGAHNFDGAGKTLAHTYYPPPNGYTAAGDAHFDIAENWDGLLSASSSGSTAQGAAVFSSGAAITLAGGLAADDSLVADADDLLDDGAEIL